jgi:hypothetical protein
MMTLDDAQDWGWKDADAQRFVTWYRKVEAAYLKTTGLDLDATVADWPAAMSFEDGDTPKEALEVILEALCDEWAIEADTFDEFFAAFHADYVSEV